jgi:CRP-like cAMP-binding protein
MIDISAPKRLFGSAQPFGNFLLSFRIRRALGECTLAKKGTGPRRLTLDDLGHNAMFSGLEEAACAKVLKSGDYVEVAVRQGIYKPEETIAEVYFPTTSVLSVVTRMRDGSQIEVGTIGREGMSALPLLMGASSTANECYCQVPGGAMRIGTSLFRELATTDVPFRQRLDRFMQAYINMLGQLAACNRLHSIYERCSRWLLMTRDRVDTDDIALTHEFLAMMLGTGRSGVSIAAGTLQQAGFIRYAQGTITILDREGLASAACECYDVARQQFGGLLRLVTPSQPTE